MKILRARIGQPNLTGLFKRIKAELFDPGFLDSLAKNTGVIKRLRKTSGADLLDTLLFDSNQSFNGMSMQLMLRQSLNISKQALHQKYNEGLTEFIKGALELLLAIELPCREIQGLEINIKDLHRSAFQKNRNKTMRAKIHKVCLYGQTTFCPQSQKKLIFIAFA